MAWLTESYYWLLLGFGLLIGELFVSGIFLMWWGFAAFVVALLAFLFPLNGTVLVITFTLLSLVFTLIGWQRASKKIPPVSLNSPELMLGRVGEIVEVVSGNIYRAKFGDTTWRVQAENLTVGDQVEVIAVEGITLSVRKKAKF